MNAFEVAFYGSNSRAEVLYPEVNETNSYLPTEITLDNESPFSPGPPINNNDEEKIVEEPICGDEQPPWANTDDDNMATTTIICGKEVTLTKRCTHTIGGIRCNQLPLPGLHRHCVKHSITTPVECVSTGCKVRARHLGWDHCEKHKSEGVLRKAIAGLFS